MVMEPGTVVVLNGAPRSGKSSIARAMQDAAAEPWVNLGVDLWMQATPAALQPGIGLRPGGERPDLESFVVASFAGLYDAVAAQSRLGLHVVVDVGHHDGYSRSLGILHSCAARLQGLPALLVGVRCPLPVIVERRNATGFLGDASGEVPDPVKRWQVEVHLPGIYDLEVDTSRQSPEACAAAILERVNSRIPGTSFAELVRTAASPG